MAQTNWLRKLIVELRPHAIWAFLSWAMPFVGAAMISALLALLQRGRNVPLDWFLFGGIFFVSFLIFLGFVYVVRIMSRAPNANGTDVETKPTNTPTLVVADASFSWCCEMVSDDQKKMGQRLLAVKWEPQRSLDGSDPYIDFDITFVNASVFDLNKPATISGKAKFRNKPLASLPQLEKSFPIPHHEKIWIKVRQFVTGGMAQEMKNAISLEQSTLLDFSDVRIPFTGYCHGIANPSFEWSGPPSISFKETTTI